MIKKLRSYNIIELTRSGLVSMALGEEYIKNKDYQMKVYYDSDADLNLIKKKKYVL